MTVSQIFSHPTIQPPQAHTWSYYLQISEHTFSVYVHRVGGDTGVGEWGVKNIQIHCNCLVLLATLEIF